MALDMLKAHGWKVAFGVAALAIGSFATGCNKETPAPTSTPASVTTPAAKAPASAAGAAPTTQAPPGLPAKD